MHSHSGEIPESEHEPVLLVEHVDGLRDAFLSFGAGVDVETGGEDHESEVLKRKNVWLRKSD